MSAPQWVMDTLTALGGNKALVMIGANRPNRVIYGTANKNVTILLPRNRASAAALRIHLDEGRDLYDIALVGRMGVVKQEVTGVYNTDVRRVVEEMTGLYLSLGTMGRSNPRGRGKRNPGNLKLTEAHYQTLKTAVTKALYNTQHDMNGWEQGYVTRKVGKDPKMRCRWDLVWHAKKYGCLTTAWFDEVYKYADDTHIDSALKRIVEELKGRNNPPTRPSHRRGTLTYARAQASTILERMPMGSLVMVGRWIDNGDYEAKAGGGMNWANINFRPVEQWTSKSSKRGRQVVKVRQNPRRRK